MGMPKISVLVADDHALFREGLSRLFQSEADLECIATAADGEEAVRLTQKFQPDVALIDVAMPKMNGIEAAQRIKATCPNTAVLIISAYKYSHYIVACVRAGVDGYLLKSTPWDKLTNAVRMLHDGEAVFSLEATGKILRSLGVGKYNEALFCDKLHSREADVLKLVSKGMTNKEISIKLGISEHTVATHIVHILSKLGVRSRVEATLHALREGWISVDDVS
jgi:DNA-binding NarL/FixJ family response regulator